ncbi:hypothetical protein B0H16DRAFT_1562561 [Mycena metata]|uniref:Uncharacterized protein n=1 Tax=Mycena metata TaxID=1033252 RepID=A0AAD7N2G3_9AGAR|nr:hypothetical protein B0H16DRAFT_1562561 [Mycena metata]
MNSTGSFNSMAPAGDDFPSESSALEADVEALGLPTVLEATKKKALSRLSVDDMKDVGWILPRVLSESDDFWGANFTGLQWVKETAYKTTPDTMMNQIQGNRQRFMSIGSKFKMQVTDDYELQDGHLNLANSPSAEESDTQLLKVCLHYVANEAIPRRRMEWINLEQTRNARATRAKEACIPQEELDLLEDGKILFKVWPDLLFAEDTDMSISGPDAKKSTSQKSASESRKLKEASLISLLRLNSPNSFSQAGRVISELTVERAVGSALNGIFYSAEKVHVISGQKLDAPLLLRPTNAFAYPDLASLRMAAFANQLESVVIRRRDLTDQEDIPVDTPKTSDSPTARAQMAAAVHPTLILLVLAHYLEKAKSIGDLPKLTETDEAELPVFDQRSMVYGIYYDETVIQILAHFPQFVFDDKRSRFTVRFYQVQVQIFNIQNITMLGKWQLVIALFHIQKHEDMLSEFLQKVIEKYGLVDGKS